MKRDFLYLGAITALLALTVSQEGAELSIEEGFVKEKAMKIRHGVEARLLAWRETLNLSEEQEARLRSVMMDGEQKLEECASSKPAAGPAFPAYLAKYASLRTAADEAIMALLSEDQRTALDQENLRERQTEAEAKAGEQLAKLQVNLILTEEQKDAAFQIYAGQALEFDPVSIIQDGRAPLEVEEEQRRAAVSRLKEILTPEQYNLFKSQAAEREDLNGKREQNRYRDSGGNGG